MPVCGSLCCFCPSLRARSRQPVKRYKKLISDIFPRSQDAQPNERMMGKLCEYTFKNPMRIPKITNNLEQRFYKELRNERFHFARAVPCIYSKLLASCHCSPQVCSPSFVHFLIKPDKMICAYWAVSLLSIYLITKLTALICST